MPLNDYEFQLDATGVVLNTDVADQPFVDITRVTGLDSAPYRETIRDHEGVDGGYFDAEFEKGRDVILEGTVYCENGVNDNIETYLDSLKLNFAPVTAPIPFYFKTPGVDERFVNVKPRGVRFDWELARRLGITNAQFMMYAEDPRLYDNDLLSVVIPFGGQAGTGFGFVSSFDFFDRTSTSGWGLLDSAETWVDSGTVTDHIVNGSAGKHSHTSAGGALFDTFGTFTVFDLTVEIETPVTSTGGPYELDVIARYTDVNNMYQATMFAETAGTVSLNLFTVVAGAFTSLGSASIGAYSPGSKFTVRFYGYGSTLQVKAWLSTVNEPTTWNVAVTNADHTTGAVGVKTRTDPSNSNTKPLALPIHSFQRAGGLAFNFGFGAVVPPTGGTVVVGGNRPAPAILTLTGPMSNPIIFNTTDSKILQFTGLDLGVSDVLVIDLLNRTVVLNGSVNKRANLLDPDWFLFNPGNTFIVLGGGSGTGTLLIEYRNAWR